MHGGDCWNTVGVQGAATCERLAEIAHCRNCPEYRAAGRRLLDREAPAGAQEECARLVAEPRDASQPTTVSVVVFRIGPEWLALKTSLFEQAVTLRAVHSVPSRTGRIFRGLVNVDGELLLCFSAGAALGLDNTSADEPGARKHGRMLVIARGGQRLAFAVDEVLGVHALVPGDFSSVPGTVSGAPDTVTTAIVSVGAHEAGLLDEERFIEHLTGTLTT